MTVWCGVHAVIGLMERGNGCLTEPLKAKLSPLIIHPDISIRLQLMAFISIKKNTLACCTKNQKNDQCWR